MKRLLFTLFVLVFVFGIAAAYAGGEGCPAAVKAACAGKQSAAKKAGCPMSKAKAETTEAEALSGKESKAKHACPDVSGRADLKGFHEAMHPMHMALMGENFEELHKCLPDLVKASQALADYKCEGYEKCSETCKKGFDGKKAEFLESIDGLAEACKGKDNEKITANFDVMHEAYITFANCCVHPEKTHKVEKAKTDKAE